MKIMLNLLISLLFLNGCATPSLHSNATAAQSRIDYLNAFSSRYVIPRNVEVWLPRQYFLTPNTALPVLYMHDGQNLFSLHSANFGVAWEVDDIAQRLMDEGKIQPAIIVGIWSTAQRRMEYFPERAAQYFSEQDGAVLDQLKQHLGAGKNTEYLADDYLRFIVSELKPYIDRHYRSLPERTNTLIAGSSMGGLISIYALAEYPEVFGSAAGVSTHWPLFLNNDHPGPAASFRQYLQVQLPRASTHRIYFDYGTATLDQYYEIHQQQVDALMVEKGYVQGRDWVTKKFPGAEHNEQAWQARIDVILEFLLKP
ncbi:alpha/beta hydrolase [Cellvibrio sp. QJXJ]|uniref:alpha/beta hydrolase n=1 Tax=Cellvibrio sp. QJXJ TaxID=2964606 RepID=UPI0021C2E349|nr:esterase family protein [Cellvibrio sp. QJXJ]UUA72133.1 esterase family protein [Cellvibrio sp. QJXJ]